MTKEATKSGLIVSITSTKLSPEFIALENKVRSASNAYLVIGENLNTINNLDYYKERGFTSFESYVETFFDITRDYAYKMISAYRVVCILKDTGCTPAQLPINESQCRPMTTLDDKDIIMVWSSVLEQGKRITAKMIKELCDKAMGKATIEPEQKGSTEITGDTGEPTGDDPKNILTGPVVNGEKMYTEQEVSILKGQLAEAKQRAATAEAKLMAERQSTVLPGGKMARMMIQAGFKAMVATMSPEEQKELLEIKKALLGN